MWREREEERGSAHPQDLDGKVWKRRRIGGRWSDKGEWGYVRTEYEGRMILCANPFNRYRIQYQNRDTRS